MENIVKDGEQAEKSDAQSSEANISHTEHDIRIFIRLLSLLAAFVFIGATGYYMVASGIALKDYLAEQNRQDELQESYQLQQEVFKAVEERPNIYMEKTD